MGRTINTQKTPPKKKAIIRVELERRSPRVASHQQMRLRKERDRTPRKGRKDDYT